MYCNIYIRNVKSVNKLGKYRSSEAGGTAGCVELVTWRVGRRRLVSYAHFGTKWNSADGTSCRSDEERWLVHAAASRPTKIQRQDSLPT
jgi:hypothetical protein